MSALLKLFRGLTLQESSDQEIELQENNVINSLPIEMVQQVAIELSVDDLVSLYQIDRRMKSLFDALQYPSIFEKVKRAIEKIKKLAPAFIDYEDYRLKIGDSDFAHVYKCCYSDEEITSQLVEKWIDQESLYNSLRPHMFTLHVFTTYRDHHFLIKKFIFSSSYLSTLNRRIITLAIEHVNKLLTAKENPWMYVTYFKKMTYEQQQDERRKRFEEFALYRAGRH